MQSDFRRSTDDDFFLFIFANTDSSVLIIQSISNFRPNKFNKNRKCFSFDPSVWQSSSRCQQFNDVYSWEREKQEVSEEFPYPIWSSG